MGEPWDGLRRIAPAEAVGTRVADDTNSGPLDAGDYSTWLRGMQAALRGEQDSDVPCGTCTACCTSSQFVHIEPDESDTLAQIPRELLFPAPRSARGHVLMGYDERGHCPMLVDGLCSIYAHRPRTCRTYDCRVFPAAGIDPDDDKPEIADRARRWQFGHPAEADTELHDATRRAAARLRERDQGSPNATAVAVRAVEAPDGDGPPDVRTGA